MILKSFFLKIIALTSLLLSMSITQAQTTRLRNDFCNMEIVALNTNIYANSVSGAIMYRYRIINLTTGVTTIYDRDRRWFNLVTAGASPEENQIFEVDVAVNMGFGFGSYGIKCLVYTPITEAPTTQLRSAFCGQQISSLGTNIYVDAILGTIMYRYRIKNITTGVTTIYDRDQRWFNLINAGASPQLAEEYLIDVAVDRGNGFGAYGVACSLFTPHLPPSQVVVADCGTTKNMLFYELINVVPNSVADGYQFRIRSESFEEVSATVLVPQIRFHDFIGVSYGKTYDVDVRLLKNGLWGPYGQVCQVSTVSIPFTQIQTDIYGGANNCGWQMPSVSSNIYAYHTSLVSSYKFKVTKGSYVDSFTTVSRRFRLIDLPNFSSNIEYNVDYNIEVAVNINGSFTNYGTMCQVTTPSSNTKLRNDFCGANLTSLGQNIYADAVTGAHQYRFEINNGSTITTFTTNNRYFNLIAAGVATFNTTYSIRVAIGVNGFFYPYGVICNVQTPSGIIQEEIINEFNSDENSKFVNIPLNNFKLNTLVVPNPFSNNFKVMLDYVMINKLVYFKITDIRGVKIHETETTIEELNSDHFGEFFSPGVYYVTIFYDGNFNTIKIIKN